MRQEPRVVDYTAITSRLPEAALFEQMAEEASELAKECLKVARILRGDNPTPVPIDRAIRNVREEYTDVEHCAGVIGISVDYDQIVRKNKRWLDRLKEKE